MMEPRDPTATFDEIRSLLLGRLAGERERLGLTQAEMARRTGLSRMTIQRAEANGADTQLSTFVAYACALGLSPELSDAKSGAGPVHEIVHQSAGLDFSAEMHPWRSRRRSTAFANAWRELNAHEKVAATLVPGLTQSQATAMAAVVAWLGTDQGIEFLCKVLDTQGYDVADSVVQQSVALPRYCQVDADIKPA